MCISTHLSVGVSGEGGVRGCTGVRVGHQKLSDVRSRLISSLCQLGTCHCENFSPEQIWRDSAHKGILLNRNRPEVAEKLGGIELCHCRGGLQGSEVGQRSAKDYRVLTSYVISQTTKSALRPNIPPHSLNLCTLATNTSLVLWKSRLSVTSSQMCASLQCPALLI